MFYVDSALILFFKILKIEEVDEEATRKNNKNIKTGQVL